MSGPDWCSAAESITPGSVRQVYLPAVADGLRQGDPVRWVTSRHDTIVLRPEGPADVAGIEAPCALGRDTTTCGTDDEEITVEKPDVRGPCVTAWIAEADCVLFNLPLHMLAFAQVTEWTTPGKDVAMIRTMTA